MKPAGDRKQFLKKAMNVSGFEFEPSTWGVNGEAIENMALIEGKVTKSLWNGTSP